jgi:hypothetical protein
MSMLVAPHLPARVLYRQEVTSKSKSTSWARSSRLPDALFKNKNFHPNLAALTFGDGTNRIAAGSWK